MKPSLHGIIVINKPAGPSSFGMVKRARRLLQVKKIGYLGTLDPFAEGVLPLCLQEATKLTPFLLDQPKTYRATVFLGVRNRYPRQHRHHNFPFLRVASPRGRGPGSGHFCGRAMADPAAFFRPAFSRAALVSLGQAGNQRGRNPQADHDHGSGFRITGSAGIDLSGHLFQGHLYPHLGRRPWPAIGMRRSSQGSYSACRSARFLWIRLSVCLPTRTQQAGCRYCWST